MSDKTTKLGPLLPSDRIRPNKLRDLHAALSRQLDDAEYRSIVEEWLRTITYAE